MNWKSLTAPRAFPRFQYEWSSLLFAILVTYFVFYPMIWLGHASFFERDFGVYELPVCWYAKKALLSGWFPQWCPQSMLGVPFFAQWDTMLLYPPTLIYLLFPVVYGVHLFMFLHLAFAGVGMYFLSRMFVRCKRAAWVVGYSFAVSGFSLSLLVWPHITATFAWLPWIPYLARRAYRSSGWWWYFGALVLQLLTGMPEFILATWVLTAVLVLWRYGSWSWSGFFKVAAAPLLACALVAVQLLPFLDLLFHSGRYAGSFWGMHYGNRWPFHWQGFVDIVAPLFHTTHRFYSCPMEIGQGWLLSFYPALVITVLAVSSLFVVRVWRGWWPLLLLAAIACFLSLPVFPLPVMHFTAKWLVFLLVVLHLLAGRAIVAFSWRRCFLAMLVLFTPVDVILALQGTSATDWNYIVRIVFALGALVVLSRPSLRRFLPLLIFADVYTHLPPMNPTVSASVWTQPLPLSVPALGQGRFELSPASYEFTQKNRPPSGALYILLERDMMGSNANLYSGAAITTGFWALQLPGPSYLQDIIDDHRFKPPRNPRSFRQWLGIRYVPSPTKPTQWHELAHWDPLVTAGQAPLPQPNHFVYSPDYQRDVLLFQPLPGYGGDPQARVSRVHVAPQRISAHVSARHPTYAVIAQAWYPAWQAYVNGHRVRILKADGFAQAVPVPAGSSSLVLVYSDPAFHWGLAVSSVTLVFLTLVGCFIWVNKKVPAFRART